MLQPEEQVFGKHPYTGDDAAIVFRSVLQDGTGVVDNYCSSPLSVWSRCWGSQSGNKNTRMYDMDTNTWTTSVIKTAKSRVRGLTVGCAGLIWSFGGDARSVSLDYDRYDIVTTERYDIITVYKSTAAAAAPQMHNINHRFQASPTGIVSVGIRAIAANTDGASFKSDIYIPVRM